MYRAMNSWQWHDPAVPDEQTCAARVQAVRPPVAALLRSRYGAVSENDGAERGWTTLVDAPEWRAQITVRTWEEEHDGTIRHGATFTTSGGHPLEIDLRETHVRRTRRLMHGGLALFALCWVIYAAMLIRGIDQIAILAAGFGLLIILPLFLMERIRSRIPDPTETVSMQIPAIVEQHQKWREVEKELLTLWMNRVVTDSPTAVVHHRSDDRPPPEPAAHLHSGLTPP